ncbi:nucleotidyltransferase domain-containing protein [Telluribacter humicola]|uniref:nucleotidyltransferase domain-containing protein n=1 Tax=Telluribacter humicola TaxID=1720261 RepID=UPI001A96682B|nr:nucleotidyltransferase domain-containing protein [Telluribacter humicola]
MNYGLPFEELEAIKNVFRNAPEVEEVILFGSRAKGNFHPGSDIDLAAIGAGLTFDHYLSLLVALDELELLYNIDVVNYNTIKNKELLDHIHRIGITIYQREEKKANK